MIFVYLIVGMGSIEMNLCRFVVLCNSIACVYIATMLRGLKRHDQVLKAYIYDVKKSSILKNGIGI